MHQCYVWSLWWYQLSKHKSAKETWVKTVKMTSAVSNRSALLSTYSIDSDCIDEENKRRMNKWVSDGCIWCVMKYHHVITMWRELWNEWDTQTSREICAQHNSAIWRTCTPEICRHGWRKTANSHLRKLSAERFWCWVRSSDRLLYIGHKCQCFVILKYILALLNCSSF